MDSYKSLIDKLKNSREKFELCADDVKSALLDFYYYKDSDSIKSFLNGLSSYYFRFFKYKNLQDSFKEAKNDMDRLSGELDKNLFDFKNPDEKIGKIQEFYRISVNFNVFDTYFETNAKEINVCLRCNAKGLKEFCLN